MKKWGILSLVCLLPLTVNAQLFEPGNVIFADPFYSPDGQIVELKINGNEAEVINVVRWPLDDTDRRRALGLDVDPNGNVWVGLTAAFDPDPDNPYPEGIGEILRIDKEGNQKIWYTDILKVTYLAAIGPNHVIVNSNVADQNLALGYRIENNEVVEITDFFKTGHGEALRLPDGQILMGDSVTPGVLIFPPEGGESTGLFSEVPDAEGNPRTVRSLTYNETIGAVVASLQDQHTIVRLSMDGEIEEEYNAEPDGFTAIWGIAHIPGTTQFVVGNHNVPELANTFGVFDALDLASGPRLIEITSGFEQAGLDEGTAFQSLFNMAVIPGAELPTDVSNWPLF